MQTDPGELFVLRNAGNIVPPFGAVDGGESILIEYAVSLLGVSEIIVCGHSHCGAMGGLLDLSQLNELPCVRSWLKHAESTRRIVEERYSHLTDPAALLTAAVEENVLVQIENLKTHPSVAAALARNSLNLHGWVYRFETGQVLGYHADERKFIPVTDACCSVPSVSRPLSSGETQSSIRTNLVRRRHLPGRQPAGFLPRENRISWHRLLCFLWLCRFAWELPLPQEFPLPPD